MQLSECVKIPVGNLRNFCVDSCANNSCQRFFDYVDSIHFARSHPPKFVLLYQDTPIDLVRVKLPQEFLFNPTSFDTDSHQLGFRLILISIFSLLLLACSFLSTHKRRRKAAQNIALR